MSDPFKREVFYEWVVEWCDKYDDILDLDHADRFSQFTPDDFEVKYEGGKTDFALQRKVGCDADGMTDQAYAYVSNGELPDEFDSGHKVPQRFKDQLTAGLKQNNIIQHKRRYICIQNLNQCPSTNC